jgi:transposase-like protein
MDGAPVPIMPVTNAIESINAQLRKIIKTRGHWCGQPFVDIFEP